MKKAIAGGAFLAALIFGMSGIVPSCTHETINMDLIDTVCFERDVLPAFVNGCATTNCHDATTHRHGLNLTSYAEIRKRVVPGASATSELFQVLTATGPERMPPDYALSTQDRIRIRLWIDQGAMETTCAADTSGGTGVDPIPQEPVCFDRDLMPVFASSCALAKCHDDITAKEGLKMTSYSAIIGKRNLVVPYSTGSSKLYSAITASVTSESHMPPRSYASLTQAQIDSIDNWISRGAKQETCVVICDTIRPVGYTEQIEHAIRRNCLGCHSGTNAGGGILLTDYASVKSAVESGKLIPAIRKTGTKKMPPSYTLSECNINLFENWITDGYIEKKGGPK
jgi:hypothetical protein